LQYLSGWHEIYFAIQKFIKKFAPLEVTSGDVQISDEGYF